jgi:hypothetical protein
VGSTVQWKNEASQLRPEYFVLAHGSVPAQVSVARKSENVDKLDGESEVWLHTQCPKAREIG